MRFISLLAATLLCFTAGSANASLIFLGPDSLAGQGIGAVTTTLTVQQDAQATAEFGCVAGGVGGATVTGAGACPPGSGPIGDPFTGTDEAAGTTAVSATTLGLTDFANLRISFNAAEPSGNSITIDNLALTLWDPTDGSLLGAFFIEDPVAFATTNPGVGILDGFFGLDDTQAALANFILAANPDLFLGLAANLSD